MLCVSFNRSHQCGVAFAIDLIKGIMQLINEFYTWLGGEELQHVL